MALSEHNRWEVWSKIQHPFEHGAGEFLYLNDAVPGITDVGNALNYLFAVLMPNYVTTVDTPLDLPDPLTLNLGDLYRVRDDGDGKSSAYAVQYRDSVRAFYKIYDMDWGDVRILSDFLATSQYQYVTKNGIQDKDASGTILAGINAGQHIYGGTAVSDNLTLHATSGDAAGTRSGYVQFDDSVRPTVDSLLTLGTNTERFSNAYLDAAVISTLTLGGGSITDSSGAVSFGDDNISTTGSVSGNTVGATTSATVNTLSFSTGSITDSTGAISFGNENISTTGSVGGNTVGATTSATVNTLSLSTGSITDSTGAIAFGNENLSTTGNVTGANLYTANVAISASKITSANATALEVSSITGTIDLSASITPKTNATYNLGTTDYRFIAAYFSGVVNCGSIVVDNIGIDGNTITATGDLTLDASGSVLVDSTLYPTGDNTKDLGLTNYRFRSIYLGTSIGDGTTTINVTDLLSARHLKYRDTGHITGVQDGDLLTYNTASGCWLAAPPNSSIAHTSLTGLTTTDAGHTQFVMLAGRAGGQTIQGGTAASENLTLESTSNATKGSIKFKDSLLANTDAAYAGGWQGVDVGGASNNIRHVYSKGEFIGFRLENQGSNPAASANNVGRAIWNTTDSKVYVDKGGTWADISSARFYEDVAFSGAELTKTVTIDGSGTGVGRLLDARLATFQLKDNSNNYEVIVGAKIESISQTQARITTEIALPAGNYRLIGVE